MKSEFFTESTLSFQSLANQTSVIQDLFLLKCTNNSQAYSICINNICMQEAAIMCGNINCSCRKMHDSCIIAELKSIVKSVQTHAKPLKHFQEKVNKFFDTTIDKLSVIRDDLIQKHRQLFQRKSYTPNQLQFISLLQSNSLKEINGALVSEITSKINDRDAINKMMKNSQEQLEKIATKMENFVNSLSSQMQKILMQLQRQFMNANHYKNIHLNEPYLFGQSQVITAQQQENVLQQFFDDNICQAKLLYRASENQFKGDMFHKSCEDIPNILVLVKTSYGKLIGGFTPLGFSSIRDVYVNDPQLKSFLFSITEGDKLSMKSQQNAIMNEKDSDYVLRFGGGSDLRISTRADQNILSYAAISTTYKNQKYASNTDSYRKFTGSDSIYFKISEWQVWKLTLS